MQAARAGSGWGRDSRSWGSWRKSGSRTRCLLNLNYTLQYQKSHTGCFRRAFAVLPSQSRQCLYSRLQSRPREVTPLSISMKLFFPIVDMKTAGYDCNKIFVTLFDLCTHLSALLGGNGNANDTGAKSGWGVTSHACSPSRPVDGRFPASRRCRRKVRVWPLQGTPLLAPPTRRKETLAWTPF